MIRLFTERLSRGEGRTTAPGGRASPGRGAARVIKESLLWRYISIDGKTHTLWPNRTIQIRCVDVDDANELVEASEGLRRLRKWRVQFLVGRRVVAEVGAI